MSLGLPVILSDVGVNGDIIEDGTNGFLANTTEEWIEKLSLLVESEQLRQDLGAAGRKTILERYSVLANRDQYVRYFNEVLKD
jgi:glycosyltransferase involved in cell wall biosynthesis